MRIALVSVAPPYRGGISLNTAILLTHLQKKHQTACFNYIRQYPEFLFPGKTQYETGKPAVPVESLRCIDSISPLSWQRTADHILKFNPDAVLFRFWNPFFAPALGWIAGRLKKKNPKIRRITLCDNILPHEGHFFDKPLISYFFKKVDSFIVLSESVEQDLHTILENPVCRKLYHPIFNVFGPIQDQQEAREKLGLKAKHVILYFGYVRKYKGLDVLIRAAAVLKNRLEDFQIVAVGESYEDSKRYTDLIEKEKVGDVFQWINTYVPDQDVGAYFSACDVVALPYHSATQSGVVPLAYHFNKPAVVTRIGGLPEVVDESKSGFLVQPDSPEELAECLAVNLANGNFSKMTAGVKIKKQQFSWETFMTEIEKILQK